MPEFTDQQLQRWLRLSPDSQRQILGKLSPGARNALFSEINAAKASPERWASLNPPVASPATWVKPTGSFGPEGKGRDIGTPPSMDEALQRVDRIRSLARAAQGSSQIQPLTEATMFASPAAEEMMFERPNFWQTAGRVAKKAGIGSATAAGTGGAIGYALGGPKGAKTGAEALAIPGLVYGAFQGFNPPPTMDELAEQKVAQQLAEKAARVRAGVEPASEETLAQMLQQEFLSPPKKSGVPQQISSPRATAPTYVPSGVPGGAATEAPRTIGQIAEERNIAAIRKAGDKLLQNIAEKELGLGKAPAEEAAPFSKLSEGPTALQHQIARQNALEDLRNATINRPGWVAKLPPRAQLAKMAPAEQQRVVAEAIASDKEAAAALDKAVRQGARVGSAGDLASWQKEELWARYMKEFQKRPDQRDSALMQSIRSEIERRGQAYAAPASVRP